GAKLLDFGLAKLRPAASSATVGVTGAPTVSAPLTGPGSIVGTYQYMAPEQLEGREADARTDIFALGAVVYEMITGRRAFSGTSQATVIASILTDTPAPMSATQPLSPPMLDGIVATCLARAPDDRWQTAGDIGRQLKLIQTGAGSLAAKAVAPVPATAMQLPGGLVLAAVATLVLAAAIGLALRYWPSVTADGVARFTISADGLAPDSVAVSPDGRFVAFVAGEASMVHVRAVDELEARPMPGTEGAAAPFWSADSLHIGFGQAHALRRIALDGGPPRTVAALTGGGFLGGSWNTDGVIVFAGGVGRPIRSVSASGGDAVDVTALEEGEIAHALPSFLPDERRFMFTRVRTATGPQTIWVGSLDLEVPVLLLSEVSFAVYAEPGFLLFNQGASLMAQHFDPDRGRLTGEPVRVADGISTGVVTRGAFSVSRGVLAFTAGSRVPATGRLTWFERDGRRIRSVGEPGQYGGVSVSPDGTRVAVHLHAGETGGGIVIWSEERQRFDQFTFDSSHNFAPVWSPDGTRIAFASEGDGLFRLYEKLASGTGTAELLLESPLPKTSSAWGLDGVLFTQGPVLNADLWRVATTADRTAEALFDSDRGEFMAVLSRDGRWLAYAFGDIATGEGDVRLVSYPGLEGPWRVGSGAHPRWAASGRELFFLNGSNTALMAASVDTSGKTPEIGVPEKLFDVRLAPLHVPGGTPYDVSSDGRFLINEANIDALAPDDTGVSESPSGRGSITVVLNWSEELTRLVPAR
ncbi:MAG TPA: protein kinase, partial [Gemmatimonadaceae bacterium]